MAPRQRGRGDPARREHAGHGRARDRGADPRAAGVRAHADHFHHCLLRRDAHGARLCAGCRGLHPLAGGAEHPAQQGAGAGAVARAQCGAAAAFRRARRTGSRAGGANRRRGAAAPCELPRRGDPGDGELARRRHHPAWRRGAGGSVPRRLWRHRARTGRRRAARAAHGGGGLLERLARRAARSLRSEPHAPAGTGGGHGRSGALRRALRHRGFARGRDPRLPARHARQDARRVDPRARALVAPALGRRPRARRKPRGPRRGLPGQLPPVCGNPGRGPAQERIPRDPFPRAA